MSITAEEKAPAHLWVIAIVTLVYCVQGSAFDHVMISLRDPDYLAFIAEVLGIPVEAVAAYYDLWPFWANLGWAALVWGAVAGSLFLILRSKYALHAFAVSLVGQIVTAYFYTLAPLPRVAGDQLVGVIDQIQQVMVVVECVTTLLLILYARWLTTRGILE